MEKDLVIIGGGPAGLAAAVSAREAGTEDILILERDRNLGGILNQCIHNGFGLHTFKEELTGPEYAARFIEKAGKLEIPYKLETMVVDISQDGDTRLVTYMNRSEGIVTIRAKAVILCMGCRERPRGALNIPGYRPAGIYTAGTAQRYVNIEGRMPGKEVVILGSGDIGLIMARRMTFEGAKVKLVAELMPYSGGLKRNVAQCLNDFDIPLLLSHTVVDIKGKERVEAVVIAEVDERSKPIPGTEQEIKCDTLLLSCGLIPENELSNGLGVEMNRVTGGPVVNESLETSVPGVFACGNVLHVHDLVDYVSEEAAQAGRKAAEYIKNAGLGNPAAGDDVKPESGEKTVKSDLSTGDLIKINAVDGVRYTVPSVLRLGHMEETQLVRFRVGSVFKKVSLQVLADGREIMNIKKQVMAPGEMEQIVLKRSVLSEIEGLKEITVRIV